MLVGQTRKGKGERGNSNRDGSGGEKVQYKTRLGLSYRLDAMERTGRWETERES